MTFRYSIMTLVFSASTSVALAQPPQKPAPRPITLREAVDLALAHNHAVRLAKLSVEEKDRVKEIAKSAYFPQVKNETSVVHLTDTQLIEIPAGGLGGIAGAPIPPQNLILNQGGVSAVTNGTGVVQPLTQLFRVKAANDVARAEAEATRGKARGVEDATALLVRQIYYRMLIADVRRRAVLAKIQASDDVQRERVQQVRYGSALEADVIETRARALQARQELLTTELQLADLQTQLNDVIGLPLTTPLLLDPNVSPLSGVNASSERCERDACVRAALDSHPEIAEARAQVEKAASAVRLAKYEIIPDVEAFARYSFQDNVPFLAGRFGTIGIRASVDLFDGGRKRAVVRERETQLAQAKENLARVSDEVELRVQTAYNKIERTRQMVAVSEELLALRGESRRVTVDLLAHGSALGSQAKESTALELDAQAALLQSQLDYVQAADEMDVAIGRRPQ
jgi:outer membrane protein TolC